VPVSWRHPDAELFELVNAVPARTIDGIVVKARCRARLGRESASDEPDASFAASLTRDLLAMKKADAADCVTRHAAPAITSAVISELRSSTEN
jgi:hypothetical protein